MLLETDRTVDAADYIAVNNVLGSYGWTFDEGDAKGWAALFTPDGVFSSDGAETVGTEALAELVQALYAQWGGRLRHLAGSFEHRYANNHDEMIVRYYSHVSMWSDQASSMMALCVARLVRGPEGWRIKRNDVRLLTAGT